MVGRTIAFCRLSTCLVLSEVDRVEKPPSYVGPIDVGQVANLRGGWLPPPVRCECGSGPIDNRPQLAKLPHKVSLAGQGANQFLMKFRGPKAHPTRVEKPHQTAPPLRHDRELTVGAAGGAGGFACQPLIWSSPRLAGETA